MLRRCADARYVWNLCVEQESWWRRGRGRAPGWVERCRQLTDARAAFPWLAEGSVSVQQQAIRDHAQAMARFFSGTHGKPTWRKAWIRFRWSRVIPGGVKSYRVARDQAGRWHVAFAAVPEPVDGPRDGLRVPVLTAREQRRLRRMERRLSRASRGSSRRAAIKRQVARLKSREDLNIKGMTRSAKGTAENPGRNVAQKAALNRAISKSAWGMLARRLEDKAPGRVEKVSSAFTSQRCVACGFTLNADVNAARNIAAGHAVKARGGDGSSRPANREPQPELLPAGWEKVGIPGLSGLR